MQHVNSNEYTSSMTKKDFFQVLIKVFGLYFLITSLFVVFPQAMNVFFGLPYGHGIDFTQILYLIGLLIFFVFLFVVLIHKPDTLLRWFRLDQGFDDSKVQFEGLTPENILKLSSIIIGGLLIIDHVPSFLSYTYNAFKNHAAGMEQSQNGSQNIHWAASFLDILIGFLLLIKYESVGKLLRSDKKPE